MGINEMTTHKRVPRIEKPRITVVNYVPHESGEKDKYSFNGYLSIKDVLAQVSAVLKSIEVLSSDGLDVDNAEQYHWQSTNETINCWPKGAPVVTVEHGTNEGIRIDVSSFHVDNEHGKPIPVFSMKYFETHEVVWRIAMLLDSAFREGEWCPLKQQRAAIPYCRLDEDGNITYHHEQADNALYIGAQQHG
jgi:hypothetical protein